MLFKDLIHSGQVNEIFVRIVDIDDPENWFYSDTVYFIGNIDIDELSAYLAPLCPDEIMEGWLNGKPVNIPDVPADQNVFSAWWD